MSWIYLLIAGILEIGWIISLKFTQGFTRPVPIIFYALFGAGSAWFLSLSMRALPMALAYVVWMGIGLVGAAAIGAMVLDEPLNRITVISMLLIVVGIVGIKVGADRDQKQLAEREAVEVPAATDSRLPSSCSTR